MHTSGSSHCVEFVQQVDQNVSLLDLQTDLLNIVHACRHTREDVKYRPRAVGFFAKLVAILGNGIPCLSEREPSAEDAFGKPFPLLPCANHVPQKPEMCRKYRQRAIIVTLENARKPFISLAI
ncbi:hypothetical protein [Sinorhizobium sp. 8-89]|uniref:hypothetical protein n=1 Tax=Sinorhizobium sp. 8-89 TaxID=3049089 RepID=UPI0025A4BA05|nr:hypothetical protein [Sinorhizobium sp. 8-89]